MIFMALLISSSISAESKVSDETPTDFNWQTIEIFKAFGNPGMLSAFLGDPSLKSNGNQVSFYTKNYGDVHAKYLIGNYSSDEIAKYTVFCLLNYAIKPCFEGSYQLSVSLNRGDHSIANMSIPMQEGEAMDLIVLAIDDFDKNLENTHLYHRAVMYTDRKKSNDIVASEMENQISYSGTSFVALNNEVKSILPSYYIDTNKSIFFHVGNGDSEPINYKIVIVSRSDTETYKVDIHPQTFRINEQSMVTHDLTDYMNVNINTLEVYVVFNPFVELEDSNNQITNKNVTIISTIKHHTTK